jgi:phospholipase D1/2
VLQDCGDKAHKDDGQMVQKMRMRPETLNSTANDKGLEEERLGYDREGNKQPNLASSLVPTLEEKTLMEDRPQSQANGKPILDAIADDTATSKQNGSARHDKGEMQAGDIEGEPVEVRVHDGSSELYGAPADASNDAQTDNQPLHARQGKDDSIDTEKAAVRGRSILRKHLSSRIGTKPWTLPVPGPIIDPHGFEDPICDEFYKDVWVAAAVHNVRSTQSH